MRCFRHPCSLSWLLIALTFVPTPSQTVAAQSHLWNPTDLSDGWRRLAVTDSVDRSGAEVDDSAWSLATLSDSWRSQGLDGFDGVLWYRRNVRVPVAQDSEIGGLAIRVEVLAHGSYQLFLDGVLVGSYGSDANSLPFPKPQLFSVPEGVLDDGHMILALRVVRVAWAADAADPSGSVVAGVFLGPRTFLEVEMESKRLDRLLADLGVLLFAVIALFFGLYHLYLFKARRDQRPYLWFGLTAICFSVNAIAFSRWAVPLFDRLVLPFKITDASGHLATVFFIPFLWGMFDRPLGRVLRSYQLSHLLLAVFVLIIPLQWVVASEVPRFVWLLPILGAGLFVVGQEARRGHPDARTLAIGGSVLVIAEVLELSRVLGASLPGFLPYAGFLGLLLSMVAALADRFSRTHAELDDLRIGLEQKVRERTIELELMTRKAIQASEAKSRFLATMSQEVRTPLKSITGFSSLLLVESNSRLSIQDREFLGRIRSSGEHLLSLADDFLDLSRIEAGKLKFARIDVHLGDLLSYVEGQFSEQAAARKIHLSFEVPTPLEPINTDPFRLKQILINLVGNSIEFTEMGTVSVAVLANGNRPMAIEVSDSGVGIPAERLQTIFEPFEKVVDPSRKRRGSAGLGLSIVSTLCDLLGHAITVQSEVGVGTTFTVILQGGAPRETE